MTTHSNDNEKVWSMMEKIGIAMLVKKVRM
jgi:hypothetical protein